MRQWRLGLRLVLVALVASLLAVLALGGHGDGDSSRTSCQPPGAASTDRVLGRVTGPEGLGLSGLEVSVTVHSGSSSLESIAETNDDGAFVLELPAKHLRSATISVLGSPDSLRSTEPFNILLPREESLHIQLSEGRDLLGRVVGLHEILGGAETTELRVEARWARVAQDDPGVATAALDVYGEFRLEQVPKSAELLVSLWYWPALADGVQTPPVVVPAGETSVQLTAMAGPAMTGRVTGLTDQSRDDVVVELHHRLDSPFNLIHKIEAELDEDDRFVVPAVPPGLYDVFVRGDAPLGGGERSATRILGAAFGWAPGGESRDLAVFDSWRSLVLDISGGTQASELGIRVWHDGRVYWESFLRVKDADDSVSETTLIPAALGECTVVVSESRGRACLRTVSASESRVELSLRTSTRLIGRLAQAPAFDTQVIARRDHACFLGRVIEGTYLVDRVPDGAYRLEVWSCGQREDEYSSWIGPSVFRIAGALEAEARSAGD